MPARRTRIDPTIAVVNARPKAQPRPIWEPSQKKVAISAMATKAKTNRKRIHQNANDAPRQ